MTPEFADTAPQAPQSPVPAGDALGPPDTHTDACGPSASEIAAGVIEWAAAFRRTVENPAPIEVDLASTLAAAGLLCTPAERELIDAGLAWRRMEITLCAGALPINESVSQFQARIQHDLRVAADWVLADREARS